MANMFDNHALSFDAELEPISSSAKPKPSRQRAPQRLRSAHLGPLAEPLDQLAYPRPNDRRQPIHLPLPSGLSRTFTMQWILSRYDELVNSGWDNLLWEIKSLGPRHRQHATVTALFSPQSNTGCRNRCR